jgi:hypothetical protein
MQTITNPVPTDSLLSGALTDEYRDLLNSFEMPESARMNVAQADTDDCDQNCDNSPSCQQPNSGVRPNRQVRSWNDLPPA